MEETLGKRIAQERRKLGITQDRLAEQLGVTAQAVSKWENDQSCPDITLLPKLAEIFGISTDALLGRTPQENEPVFEAEVVKPEEDKKEASWEFQWNSGRRSSIAFALWVLLVGGLLLTANLLKWDVGFWEILWPSCPLVFGLVGLVTKFSFFNLGCALFGGYFLLDNLNLFHMDLNRQILLPAFLLLFGASLLVDAFKKPRKHTAHFHGSSKGHTKRNCTIEGESFDSDLSFGEDTHYITLPRLQNGSANVSFGELKVDLSGCEEIAGSCVIEACCSFGELNFRVPRRFQVETRIGSSFGSVDIEGHPDPNPAGTILLEGSVSFGQISVHYV